jgi:hypothetical protein
LSNGKAHPQTVVQGINTSSCIPTNIDGANCPCYVDEVVELSATAWSACEHTFVEKGYEIFFKNRNLERFYISVLPEENG